MSAQPKSTAQFMALPEMPRPRPFEDPPVAIAYDNDTIAATIDDHGTLWMLRKTARGELGRYKAA